VELTITQAAQSLECSVDTVRRHIRSGKLPARKDDQGRYLIQFDDVPEPRRKRRARAAEPLEWLNTGADAAEESEPSAVQDRGRNSPPAAFAGEDEFPAALPPQRRRTDPGLDARISRLLQERDEMVQELQMWRNEAMAAQVALEELRRLIPRTLEPKRIQGWWRFGRS
jgi:excisionase family DNA binding protein